MTITTTASAGGLIAAPTAAGFDEHLGSSGRRYLGQGHRRVGITTSTPVADLDGGFTSTAQLEYPADWSTKAGRVRTPHLSTVDAMRISAEIRVALMLGPLPWLRAYGLEQTLQVRAGAKPWEALGAVPVRTELDHSSEESRVRLRHTVGSLVIESVWERGADDASVNGWSEGTASEVDLVDADAVRCNYVRGSNEAAAIPFLEALMLTAQMSQVALYGGDAAQREQSGNMWMRRARFERTTVDPRRRGEVLLQLQNRRDLVVGGRAVSTAEVLASDVFGVYVTASLAAGS